MNKFFAILAAVCLLAVGNVFANTWSQTNNGSYTATIVCEPTLTGGTTITLGNFFATGTMDAFATAPTAQQWTLTGPNATAGASYTFKFDGTSYSASTTGIEINGNSSSSNVLKGDLTIPSLDGIGCTTGVDITFQPTALKAVTTGSETFDANLEVDASI